MTEAQALELATQRFVDTWPGASGSVPYALANKARLSADTFAQLQFLPNGRVRIDQGAGVTYQQTIWVVVQIWTPANTGVLLAAQLADAARVVFERQTLIVGGDELTIDAGMPRNIAASVDGRWAVSAVQFLGYWMQGR